MRQFLSPHNTLKRMSSRLARLEGMTLKEVFAAEDTLSLVFDGGTLAFYNPHQLTRPTSSLVGLTVKRVAFSRGLELKVCFRGGDEAAVSLKDADYTGPEAFCAKFQDGEIVVE